MVNSLELIKFYRTREPYGWMSNFARFAVTLDGKVWPTSEHYFQAQKFESEALQEKVRLAPNPKEAAAIGRDRTLPLRSDWDSVKDDIMREVVLAKFTQHDDLRQQLLDTGDAILCEHTEVDKYWADGGDGSGLNMLGKILMETREILKKENNIGV